MNDAERIQTLRTRSGRTASEMAQLSGMAHMEYFDLEFHDDELKSVPSLAAVKRLASALGVPTRRLFVDEPDSPSGRHVSYDALVALVRRRVAADGSQEPLEDEIGWYLDDFLAGEAAAMAAYPVEFLIALCERLAVDWLDALP